MTGGGCILRKTFKIKLETSFAKVRIFNFRLEKSIKIIDIAISLTVTQSKRIGLSAHVKSRRSDFKQKSELDETEKARNKISYARNFLCISYNRFSTVEDREDANRWFWKAPNKHSRKREIFGNIDYKTISDFGHFRIL